jgi:hypothetical protein
VQEASGLVRWRRARELEREVKAEARRRGDVPTVTEYEAAQQKTDDVDPDARQVEQASR